MKNLLFFYFACLLGLLGTFLVILLTITYNKPYDSKLNEHIFSKDTVTTCLFVKNGECLEVETFSKFPGFSLVGYKALNSGSYKLSQNIGIIYELKLTKIH